VHLLVNVIAIHMAGLCPESDFDLHCAFQGVVGVASAGPGFYVIALADPTVQHGALVGRLQTLGSHVSEALSQL
jgi:hypothetical protein